MNMNVKLLETQIEALTYEHARKIVAFYKRHGFNTSNHYGTCSKEGGDTNIFYGVDRAGNFNNRWNTFEYKEIRIITLELAKAIVSDYPKIMECWNSIDKGTILRKVIGEVNGMYIAYKHHPINDDKYTQGEELVLFIHAKDVEQQKEFPMVEEPLTIEERLTKIEKHLGL